MAEPAELPDRIKRDLDEALREGGIDKLPSRPPRQRGSFSLGRLDPRPRNPGQLVLMGAALFVIGFVLWVPGPKGWFMVAGGLCILVALMTHFLQPQGYKPKYWRGRWLDVPTGRWQERVYRIIYRIS
jgi:hypothetical protein